MRKRDEIERADSCLNKALDNELVFVALARDEAAPAAVRAWAAERVRLRLNTWDDAKIRQALACAAEMEYERSATRKAALQRDIDKARMATGPAFVINDGAVAVPAAFDAYGMPSPEVSNEPPQ